MSSIPRTCKTDSVCWWQLRFGEQSNATRWTVVHVNTVRNLVLRFHCVDHERVLIHLQTRVLFGCLTAKFQLPWLFSVDEMGRWSWTDWLLVHLTTLVQLRKLCSVYEMVRLSRTDWLLIHLTTLFQLRKLCTADEIMKWLIIGSFNETYSTT